MAHVLIGFAEAVPAPEVVFSLRAAGHRVSAFARRDDIPLAHLPLEALHVLKAPELDCREAIAGLNAILDAEQAPDAVLPLDDAGLWLVTHARPEDPRLAGAVGLQAEVALDKSRQIDAARDAGLAVPATRLVTRPEDLDEAFALPAILKPAYALHEKAGRLHKGRTTYLMSQQDVQEARSVVAQEGEPFLVQPLIEGEGEGVFGFMLEDGVLAWSGHRRLRMMNPHGSGSSACISTTPAAELRQQVEAFLRAIGWRGPFMVELLRDRDGKAWFMELNGRMWGSLALARRQGFEYPAWEISRLLTPRFRPAVPETSATPVVQRNLGRDLLHLLFVLRGPQNSFYRAQWPRFLPSLVRVLRPAHPRNFYNYDPAHRTFFLRDALWTIRKVLKR